MTEESEKHVCPPIQFAENSWRTMMIMGAVLSGGDPIKMAQLILDKENKNEST